MNNPEELAKLDTELQKVAKKQPAIAAALQAFLKSPNDRYAFAGLVNDFGYYAPKALKEECIDAIRRIRDHVPREHVDLVRSLDDVMDAIKAGRRERPQYDNELVTTQVMKEMVVTLLKQMETTTSQFKQGFKQGQDDIAFLRTENEKFRNDLTAVQAGISGAVEDAVAKSLSKVVEEVVDGAGIRENKGWKQVQAALDRVVHRHS